MLKPGEILVWRVALDRLANPGLPPASPEEEARAARFVSREAGERYLRAHRSLRAILACLTGAAPELAAGENGKPFLPGFPDLGFNLSHSKGVALVAAALTAEVGVDVEYVRPVPECDAIAGRFFPPTEAAAFAAALTTDREREFFRHWTRIEAMLKARGVGLRGAGAEIGGEWTVREIEAPPGYVAAVAAERAGMRVRTLDF